MRKYLLLLGVVALMACPPKPQPVPPPPPPVDTTVVPPPPPVDTTVVPPPPPVVVDTLPCPRTDTLFLRKPGRPARTCKPDTVVMLKKKVAAVEYDRRHS